MSMECLFCKIARDELSAYCVAETPNALAFLDNHPISEGHTLVIPKKHFESVFDIEKPILHEIMDIAKSLALKYKHTLHVDAVNLLNASGKAAQQSIFHFHLHVVPRIPNDGLNLWFHGNGQERNDLQSVYAKLASR